MIDEIGESLLRQAPDALIVADSQGRIVFANAAVSALFGYAENALLNQPVEVLMPSRFRSAHIDHRANYDAQPVPRAMGQRGVPLFGLHRDGREFPIWVSLSPIQYREQQYIATTIRDMSDWHHLTEELRHAGDAAKSAAQVKGRFLATASHDLRQPLQALRLLNTTMRAALERKDNVAVFARMLLKQQHAIASMTELLNALLDMSKLESGTVQPHLEPVHLDVLAQELREQVDDLLEEKGLKFTFDCERVIVRSDRILLRQLIQNLLANAIKYTDIGEVTLRIGANNGGVYIEIADTGVGIPRDQIARIFDAFYQTPGEQSAGRGVGLGLAIVKQITDLLGYGIGVESQPGHGTRFRINIPGNELCSPTSTPPRKLIAAARTQLPAIGILVIEDDDAVRNALALVLELEGLSVVCAASEAQALAAMDTFKPSIQAVVSDFHIGASHTGFDIVTALRRRVTYPLPAVFLTGDTSIALRTRQAVPNSRLLNKPVDADALLDALHELLSIASSSHSTATT